MFNKKNSKPPLAYFQLSFNMTAMHNWVINKCTINPESEWDNSDVKKEYLITMLPQDPFLFYHNEVNDFSPAIGGFEYIEDKKIGSIEWKWDDRYFIVLITDEIIPIFFAPLDEIFFLLKNKKPNSENLLKDMDGMVVDTGYGGNYCTEIYKNIIFTSGIAFSNSLVKLSVIYADATNLVKY